MFANKTLPVVVILLLPISKLLPVTAVIAPAESTYVLRSGGVKVNPPVLSSYVSVELPAAATATLISVSAIPLAAFTQALPLYFST